MDYKPDIYINKKTIATVLEALYKRGEKELQTENDSEFVTLSQAVEDVRKEMGKSPANRLLMDL
jgi:hypothetical protein